MQNPTSSEVGSVAEQNKGKQSSQSDKSKNEEQGLLESQTNSLAAALLGGNLNQENDNNSSNDKNTQEKDVKDEKDKNNGNPDVDDNKKPSSESDEEDIPDKPKSNELGQASETSNESDDHQPEKDNFNATIPLDDFESTQKIEPVDEANEKNEEKVENSANSTLIDTLNEITNNLVNNKDADHESEKNISEDNKNQESEKDQDDKDQDNKGQDNKDQDDKDQDNKDQDNKDQESEKDQADKESDDDKKAELSQQEESKPSVSTMEDHIEINETQKTPEENEPQDDSYIDQVKIDIQITDQNDADLTNDQTNKNASDKDESSTFATNPTKIDIKLSNGNSPQYGLSSASSSSRVTSRTGRSNNANPFYSDELSPRTKFKYMIYGDPSKRASSNLARSYYQLKTRSNANATQVDPSVIQSAADSLLSGKPLKATDPYEVAGIIEDLNGRKIEALANNDYKQSKKIKDTIESTRKQFRINDREKLHKKVVEKLEERNKESIQELNATKDKWKKEHKVHQQQNTQCLVDLQNRHQDQHEQLETSWTQPKILHKFDKRSPVLLDMRQREHYMLLAGMYTEADQQKRANSQMERREIQSRNFEMGHHFKLARTALIHKQDEEVDNVKMDIVVGDELFKLKERREMDVRLKRLHATQFNLDDEKNVDNFIAKRFKRPKTTVVPSTVMVTRENCDDIPVCTKGPTTVSQNAQDMMLIRKKNLVTPLPIQPLSIRKYKTQKIVKTKK